MAKFFDDQEMEILEQSTAGLEITQVEETNAIKRKTI